MNRLIIIGNGFDIAHKLKTKYSDFIDQYWQSVLNTEHDDAFLSFGDAGYDLKDCKKLRDVIEYLNSKGMNLSKRTHSPDYFHNNKSIIKIHNEFFCRINERYDDANWVDIEMEYYTSLKRILSRQQNTSDNDIFEAESLSQIRKLNNDIAEIAKQFESYLVSNVVPYIDEKYNSSVKEVFENYDLSDYELERFFDEFPRKFADKILKPLFQAKQDGKVAIKKFEDTYVLNFNYTKTVAQYLEQTATIINIHGELRNFKNAINLGFGDERDKFYSEIEDYNQNEYLRFMKSFYYTKNNNYKKLFDFIEDTDFQVQIMGHSCGLSDRTLLNAIFEHPNCKSIKVFYHQYDSENDIGEMDNHSEVVRNISRHFTQKTNMRDKIVNRVRCRELPQNRR